MSSPVKQRRQLRRPVTQEPRRRRKRRRSQAHGCWPRRTLRRRYRRRRRRCRWLFSSSPHWQKFLAETLATFTVCSARESLLKGEAQYSWPPSSDKFRSAAFITEKCIFFFVAVDLFNKIACFVKRKTIFSSKTNALAYFCRSLRLVNTRQCRYGDLAERLQFQNKNSDLFVLPAPAVATGVYSFSLLKTQSCVVFTVLCKSLLARAFFKCRKYFSMLQKALA